MKQWLKIRRAAVAIKYDARRDEAPQIAAKGQGFVADRIIQAAAANGIPIRKDRDLVEVLSCLDVSQEIPPEVYVVVAEILAFIYAASGKAKNLTGGSGPGPTSGEAMRF